MRSPKFQITRDVEKWNVKLIINQNKLVRLVSSEVAAEFNNYETDNPELKEPKSIHGKFFVAHRAVRELLNCVKSTSCETKRDMQKKTNEILRDLDFTTDGFVDRVSALFLERATQLEDIRSLK